MILKKKLPKKVIIIDKPVINIRLVGGEDMPIPKIIHKTTGMKRHIDIGFQKLFLKKKRDK